MKLKKQLVMMNMSDLRFICKELSISCPEKKSDIINKLLQPLTNKYRFFLPLGGGKHSRYDELMNRSSNSTANDSAISYSDDEIYIHDLNIALYLNRMKEQEQMLDKMLFDFNNDLAEYWLKNATSESKYWMKQLYIWDLVDTKIKRWKKFCDDHEYTSGTLTVNSFLSWDKYAEKLKKDWDEWFIPELVEQEKQKIENFCLKKEYLKRAKNNIKKSEENIVSDKIPKDFVE